MLSIFLACSQSDWLWADLLIFADKHISLADIQGLIFNEMRSKTKSILTPKGLDPTEYPNWSFDGSSTGQAEGGSSDCILRYRSEGLLGSTSEL